MGDIKNNMICKLKVRILVFLFWPSIIAYSCNLDSARLAEVNREYRDKLNVFDAKFLKHFPKKITQLPSHSMISEACFISHPGFWLKLSYTHDTINKIVTKALKDSKAVYSANDSCLLMIDQHLNEDNWLKYDKTLRMGPKVDNIDKPCHVRKLPVPKFWEEGWKETDETAIGLDPDYKLYVLEAKSGIYMDKKRLPNGKYTPSDWKHGYSRGIAVNEKTNTVIYWFDIW